MVRKVLLTGGAGFIGSFIAEKLAEKDYEITIYDNLSTGSLKNIAHLLKKENVKFVQGDILDINRLVDVCKGVDVILHQAAQLEISTAVHNPIKDLRVNVEGTINVLEAAVKCGVKKILFASSAAVYGEPIYLPQDEDHPKNPKWPYGASKLASEYYLKVYHELRGIKSVSLRYGIVYGPREWFGRVLTIFIKRVFIEDKPPVVFGSGDQTRDFVYVEDVAEACRIIVESGEFDYEIYNVSSGTEITVKDLAKMVIELSGKDMDIIFEDVPEGGYSKLTGRWRIVNELKRMRLDIRRIEQRYGWRPVTEFKEGLLREIKWVLENPERWNYPPRV